MFKKLKQKVKGQATEEKQTELGDLRRGALYHGQAP